MIHKNWLNKLLLQQDKLSTVSNVLGHLQQKDSNILQNKFVEPFPNNFAISHVLHPNGLTPK